MKFLVCVTAVILLSSTTRLRDMVVAADRMGVPREFTQLVSMMVRYLFLFWAVLKRIKTAQETRLFDIWNNAVPRKWILKQIGYSISAIFVRSYEQGERTYISMLCRGYGSGHEKAYYRAKIQTRDILFLSTKSIVCIHFLSEGLCHWHSYFLKSLFVLFHTFFKRFQSENRKGRLI